MTGVKERVGYNWEDTAEQKAVVMAARLVDLARSLLSV